MTTERISRRITVEWLDHDLPKRGPLLIPAVFTSTTEDPFAVTLKFPQPDNTLWYIGRDLLTDGMSVPTGEGDVRVQPDPDDREFIQVILDSPDGHAELRINRDHLGSFLANCANHGFTDLTPAIDQWLLEIAA